MKIDKKNYHHWLILIRSIIYIGLTLPLRHIGPKRKIVILYGHKLNGNLKTLLDSWQDQKPKAYEIYFATLDNDYYQQLKNDHYPVLNLGRFRDVLTVSKSRVIITDHGLHTLVLYRMLTSIKFVDVWHGIPFKGFDQADFRHLHKHDQIWTSSLPIKRLYIEKFGFAESRVRVTGYARVDRLINNSLDKTEIVSRYGLKQADKYVLMAPTWQQDDKGRSLLPFGLSPKKFFTDLDKIMTRQKAIMIVRTHLNSQEDLSIAGLKNIVFMPYSKFPVAEDFLFIADMLITDWSSIGFDFLPLDRPTIYLDVPVPFKKGFSVGPEHRYGKVVDSYEELKKYTSEYLAKPASYKKHFAKKMNATKSYIYGNTLDGKSTQRYQKELKKLLT